MVDACCKPMFVKDLYVELVRVFVEDVVVRRVADGVVCDGRCKRLGVVVHVDVGKMVVVENIWWGWCMMLVQKTYGGSQMGLISRPPKVLTSASELWHNTNSGRSNEDLGRFL